MSLELTENKSSIGSGALNDLLFIHVLYCRVIGQWLPTRRRSVGNQSAISWGAIGNRSATGWWLYIRHGSGLRWKKLKTSYREVPPRKFWDKKTHLEHFRAFWSIMNMVLGDPKKRKSVKKLKTLMPGILSVCLWLQKVCNILEISRQPIGNWSAISRRLKTVSGLSAIAATGRRSSPTSRWPVGNHQKPFYDRFGRREVSLAATKTSLRPNRPCNRSPTSRRSPCNRPATSLRPLEILVARRSPTGCKLCVTGALHEMYHRISVLVPVLVRVPEYLSMSTNTSTSTITLVLTSTSTVRVPEIQYSSTASTSTEYKYPSPVVDLI